jgi:hypothetical protein
MVGLLLRCGASWTGSNELPAKAHCDLRRPKPQVYQACGAFLGLGVNDGDGGNSSKTPGFEPGTSCSQG